LDSGHTWQVTCSTPPPSLNNILRLFVLEFSYDVSHWLPLTMHFAILRFKSVGVFSKNLEILFADGSRGPSCITVPNLIKIGQSVAERHYNFSIFQDGGRPPYWIFEVQFSSGP